MSRPYPYPLGSMVAMPTYSYQFLDSETVTEVAQSIHDEALTEIDGRPVKRVYKSTPFIVLNTTGFYRTGG